MKRHTEKLLNRGNIESYSAAKLDEELIKIETQILKQLEKLTLKVVELLHEHFVLFLSAPSLVDL
jgi:hypothetical protein